jgi:hypothetical protein
MVDRRSITSRLNGAKAKPNYNPTYDHFNNQEGNPRGSFSNQFKELLGYALRIGAITSLSETPSIDFLRACVVNEDLRVDLRLTAAGYAAKYEAHAKGPRPYVPKLPQGFKLPRLDTVARCQEALAIIAESLLDGTLALDAAEYLRKHVDGILPSLQHSEIDERLEEFRTLVEQVEAARQLPPTEAPVDEPPFADPE